MLVILCMSTLLSYNVGQGYDQLCATIYDLLFIIIIIIIIIACIHAFIYIYIDAGLASSCFC